MSGHAAVLALLLGQVEPLIGQPDEPPHDHAHVAIGMPDLGDACHPDGNGDLQPFRAQGFDPDGLHLSAQLLHEGEVFIPLSVGTQDQEFLATEAPGPCARWQHALHQATNLLQHLVAKEVAMPVVDRLEVVQVEHGNGEGGVAGQVVAGRFPDLVQNVLAA